MKGRSGRPRARIKFMKTETEIRQLLRESETEQEKWEALDKAQPHQCHWPKAARAAVRVELLKEILD